MTEKRKQTYSMSKYLPFLFFSFSYLLLDFFGCIFFSSRALCRTFSFLRSEACIWFSSFSFFFLSFNLLLVFGVEFFFFFFFRSFFRSGGLVDIFFFSFSCSRNAAFLLIFGVEFFFSFRCFFRSGAMCRHFSLFFFSLLGCRIFLVFGIEFFFLLNVHFAFSLSPSTLVIRNWFPCSWPLLWSRRPRFETMPWSAFTGLRHQIIICCIAIIWICEIYGYVKTFTCIGILKHWRLSLVQARNVLLTSSV